MTTNDPVSPHGTLGYQTRTTWVGDKYGGLEERILVNPNGSLSENLAIIKHGKIVNTMSTGYHVFSNDDLAEILDEVAHDLGAVPFVKDRGIGKWGKQHGNIIEDTKYGTRALISYKFPEQTVDITGQGDANIPTFSGSNSEDGRGGSLKILGGFVRTICDNLCYTFVPAKEITGLNAGIKSKVAWNDEKFQQVNPEIIHQVGRVKEAVKDLKESQKRPKFYTKHSKQVKDLDKIRENIKDAIEAIKVDNEVVATRYRELYKLKLNSYLAMQLVNDLPKSVYESVPALELGKDGKITYDEKLNDWDVYNYITEELTYNQKSTKTFGSTLTAQKKVEQIFLRQPIEVLAH